MQGEVVAFLAEQKNLFEPCCEPKKMKYFKLLSCSSSLRTRTLKNPVIFFQEQPEPQPAAFTTEAAPATPAEEPVYPSTEATANRPKVHQGKKNRKPPVAVDDDEEEDEDDDELSVPFVPFKGNRRRQNYPNLNNFFPMMFSFHGANTRSGTSGSGSPPGAITAIANSYSTAKGGVASSVATAYGGSPNG